MMVCNLCGAEINSYRPNFEPLCEDAEACVNRWLEARRARRERARARNLDSQTNVEVRDT